MITPSMHFPHVDPLLMLAFWTAAGGVIAVGLLNIGRLAVERSIQAMREREERRGVLREGVYRVRRPGGGFVITDRRRSRHHRTHGFLGARYTLFTEEQWARLAAIRDSGTTAVRDGYRIERLGEWGKWAAIDRAPVAV